jgi:hypothetical protein
MNICFLESSAYDSGFQQVGFDPQVDRLDAFSGKQI